MIDTPSPTEDRSSDIDVEGGKVADELDPMRMQTYDITPVGAAVHPCGIYCMDATADFRSLYTGSEDGFIRKYDLVKGDLMLTIQQRHGLAASVQQSAALLSAWNNEEPLDINDQPQITNAPTLNTVVVEVAEPDASRISPVYSIAVHSRAEWCIAGTQNGYINLYSTRYREGECFHSINGHSSAVSVLLISEGERECISGSWDRAIKQWSLDTGRLIREYDAATSQITSASLRPLTSTTNMEQTLLMSTSYDGTIYLHDSRSSAPIQKYLVQSGSPKWSVSVYFDLK